MVETTQGPGAQTFPQLLLMHAQIRGQRPAFREKDLGIWQITTWSQVAQEVRAFACGLAALGFQRGMSLAIIGNNCPRLYWAMSAAQCLGGMPVPLYQDAPAADMAYVMHDAEVDFVVAEDQEQVDKVFDIKQNLSDNSARPSHVIYDDERGMRNYLQPELSSFFQVQELGRAYDRDHPDFFMAQVAALAPDDIAIILYTSGTTGKPKGVCHSHAAMIATARTLVEFDQFNETDEVLCYLPLAWVGDFLYCFAQAHVAGFCLNCPESPSTVATDLREIGPTYYFAPPRIYENILTQVMIRIEDAGWIKRTLFHSCMKIARRVGMRILDKKPDVSLTDRLLYALGNVLIYGPLKNVLGMSRIRVAYTGGEAIGPDLFDFYRSLGINLKQLYGMTETCVTVCMQPSGDVKLDTVGRPMKGVEVHIDGNGEVLVRSPGLMKSYFKRPDATAEAIDENGYFHTGDAVVFGNQREQCTAFINIDMDAVGNWAERRHLAYSGYTDLAAHQSVYALIAECVEKVNADLVQDPLLADSQVHRFLILHKELDPDDDELTRTRKVRRGFIAEKYGVLIEALYAGKQSQYIETQVKFEDGRQGMISADLKIADVKTFANLNQAA